MQVDDNFLEKARRVVEENRSKPEFGVHELCRHLNIGRTQLHNRLKAHTGQPAALFIRTVRLQYARVLLETTTLNVSEVAYRVGFSDPNYFSRCYKQAFGVSPSESRKCIAKKNIH